jgi:SET domain-containing protein
MKKNPPRRRTPLFEVRHSPIHGFGVFATRRIRKGTMVIEYLGDRVSHAQADARYEDKDPNDNHTFLFTVDAKTVIDAGVNGNEARYINHGCDPNCESTTVKKRIFIAAIRTIQPGEELSYDYQIQRDSDDEPNVDEVYACRCGALNCRGSMLEPAKKPRKPARRTPSRAGGTKGAARKRSARRGGTAKRSQRRGDTAKRSQRRGR